MIINILLSFDHELSLGRSDSYIKDLFEPTDRILDVADECEVPITLFTDILCAKRFLHWDYEGFYLPWSDQIHEAIQRNHDVQLHLHPHWIDSEYVDNKFKPSNHFKLSDFYSQDYPDNIEGIIEQSVSFLTTVARESFKEYKCVAYRAGGFNISDKTQSIFHALFRNGIRIDSSIVKDFNFESKISNIDFRNMPSSANWFVPINGENSLFEIPIASSPRTPINNLPFLVKRIIYKNRKSQSYGNGIHFGRTTVLQKFKRLFPNSAWSLGFDNYTYSVQDLLKILDIYLKKYSEEDEIFISTVSHPKSMGNYAFRLMKDFINSIRNKYTSVRFLTFYQAAKEI